MSRDSGGAGQLRKLEAPPGSIAFLIMLRTVLDDKFGPGL